MLLNHSGVCELLSVSESSQKRLMLFDLSVEGHHPSYILYLIQYWYQNQLSGQLDIVVSPEFIEKHSDVVQTAQRGETESVRFIPITSDEYTNLNDHNSPISRAIRSFKEWGVFCKYAKQYRADHALLMYLDTAQVPFIFGPNPPCTVSGIYFRPTFHYSSFENYQAELKDKIQALRERFNLSMLLRNSKIGNLLCLDPFVSEHIQKIWKFDKALTLADPVKLYPSDEARINQCRQDLNIAPDRFVFLMFGALTKRKGIEQVLEAIPLLPKSLCQEACLLLVGPLGSGESEKSHFKSRIAQLMDGLPIQIIIDDKFIADEDVQPYFELSDVVLATYQKHIGMSGILNRAALAQKPVISSDYGLMGEVTRRFGLGITVDSTSASTIAEAFMQCLTKNIDSFCDRSRMQAFGEQNLAECFSSTIFKQLIT